MKIGLESLIVITIIVIISCNWMICTMDKKLNISFLDIENANLQR
jgi:hypothetical protein